MSDAAFEIGVDIGGTFTDVVCRMPGQAMRIMKIPSTPSDPSAAVLQSLEVMRTEWGIDGAGVARFVHGTTIATNAVLERKGAKLGLLTTAGFRDLIEIGRQMRHQMYDLALQPETPTFLAPGARRKEIVERIDASGRVLLPLDDASVVKAGEALVSEGVEAVAICFLFSFLNPSHERRARQLLKDRFPDLAISISSEVDPAFREYERTVVTAFDAYLKPVIDRYLRHLEDGLKQADVAAPLQVMQSRGGVSAAAVARERPVRLFLSGPAAGVIGGRIIGETAGIGNIITVDIGGTSCDIALVSEGKPLIRSEGRIDTYVVRVPMVDVNAIGAGGGSIAWIDGAGGLRVGPHSAGSEPGPACYGRGGSEATVTDASIVLGYIDPDYFAGGSLQLRPERAQQIIEQRIAGPLHMPVQQAALGIHRVMNAQVAEGIRLVSIRQGFDPRKFTLVPLGGAGPLHATAVARELKIGRILVPRHPGVLSAAGLLAAEVEHEVSQAFPRELAGLTLADVRAELEVLAERCSALMGIEHVRPDDIRVRFAADVCYVGQSYHLEVPLLLEDSDPLRRLYLDFLDAHDRVYGHGAEAPARIVNLRCIQRAGGLARLAEDGVLVAEGEPRKGRRQVMLAESSEAVEATVYDRALLAPGVRYKGPAIIEQQDSTTLVEPGWRFEVVAGGGLLLTMD